MEETRKPWNVAVIGARWKVRSADGFFREFVRFEEAWEQALDERSKGWSPAILHLIGEGEQAQWVELHELMIPREYLGKDDQSSRVRRLVEQKIVFAALREKLGLGEDANIDAYL